MIKKKRDDQMTRICEFVGMLKMNWDGWNQNSFLRWWRASSLTLTPKLQRVET